MNAIITDIKKIPKLIIGFLGIAFGIILIKNSSLGLFPWGVFHQGLEMRTPLTFGQVTQVVGIVILLISLFINIYPGVGTVLNIILIGTFVDVIEIFFKIVPSELWMKIVFLIIGIVINSLGRALYISCELGKGPRDGLFIGITKITGISVKYSKPITEIIALIIGFLLGGIVGVGSVIMLLFSGIFVHYFFIILKYNPKEAKQRKFKDYFKRNHKEVLNEKS